LIEAFDASELVRPSALVGIRPEFRPLGGGVRTGVKESVPRFHVLDLLARVGVAYSLRQTQMLLHL
jgi:hypothetical protein